MGDDSFCRLGIRDLRSLSHRGAEVLRQSKGCSDTSSPRPAVREGGGAGVRLGLELCRSEWGVLLGSASLGLENQPQGRDKTWLKSQVVPLAES